jgi:GTP-binding protein YchF
MEAGIVGLPYVGKTALFNALVAGHAPHEAHGGVKANVGVVPVPDPRLATITKFIPTVKIVPASLKLVDVPGLARGASTGSGMGNKFLSAVRNVDALVHVVRCFDTSTGVPHVEDTVDPARDVETIDTELILADMEQLEGMLDKAQRHSRAGDPEAKLRLELLEVSLKALGDCRPLRTLANQSPFNTPDAHRVLAAIMPLTIKPMLYVANVGEDDVGGQDPLVGQLREAVGSQAIVVPVCAKLEAELAELPESERGEMLTALGLAEPAIAVLARAVYRLLGLQSFFTAGPDENRAWTIPAGATAPEAAGAVHSDMQRGFIRAEVYSVDDLVHYGSEKAIREAGKMRVEGKAYVMRDSDVCNFLFNV